MMSISRNPSLGLRWLIIGVIFAPIAIMMFVGALILGR